MILNGLGGPALSAQHADHSARLLNATQPEYAATLVVGFPLGEARFRKDFPGWQALTLVQQFAEMERFLARSARSFAANASNWLVLKGTLGANKERLLQRMHTSLLPLQGGGWEGMGRKADSN